MGKNANERGSRRRARIEQRRAEGIAQAIARNIRVSPLKARRVIDMIRGKDLAEALAILTFTPSLAAEPIKKVVASAAANAEDPNQMGLDPGRLYVKACYVDCGFAFKRMHPTTQGRARVIKRRTSHITVLVAERPRVRVARAGGSK
jgi:large subunit ribosomal protein L22